MKSHQIFSTTDEDTNSEDQGTLHPEAFYCWWRAAAIFDECTKLRSTKLEGPAVSGLSPRVRVLREMERLAMVASDGLDELRHKLLSYRAGDFWVPTGGIGRDGMDNPEMNTILLVGFRGSGKSALINLMYSVLGRGGLIPFAQTSTGKETLYFSFLKI